MENSYLEEYAHFYSIIGVIMALLIFIFKEIYVVLSDGMAYSGWMFYVAIFGAIALVKVVISRESYLPFLGKTVMPAALLTERENKSRNLRNVHVKVPPNAKVVYWAAQSKQSNDSIVDVQTAYSNYENSGVVVADVNGIANLKVQPPQPYTVPSLFTKTIKPHVHYRYELPGGMLSDVETINMV